MRETTTSVLFLALLAGVLYIFSPESRFLGSPETLDQLGNLKIDIKERSLADPRQADLRAKVGQVAVLVVTTDEDGRVILQSEGRDIFNPIFKGAVNTITVPTDRPGVYRVTFNPGAGPLDLNSSPDVIIGAVVIEN